MENSNVLMDDSNVSMDDSNVPVSLSDWAAGLSTGTECTTILCFPIKLPLCLVFCLPCAFYNAGRNKCAGTTNKNYLC